MIRVPTSEHNINTSYDTDLYVESHVYSVMSGGRYTDGIDVCVITLNRVNEASASDPEIQLLVKTIIKGFQKHERNYQPSFRINGNYRMICHA